MFVPEKAMPQKLCVVGLGLMGTVLAAKLVRAGYEVRGYDIDKERMSLLEENGGTPAESPAGAAAGAAFVVLSLMNSDIVREVCFGAEGFIESAEESLLVIDTTTSRPEDSIETAAGLRRRGFSFLDVSLSGSRDDIVALAGGDESDLERARPVIAAFARSCHHMGPSGAGARTKLIVNLISGLNRLVMAEGLVLGMKSGMDMEALLEVLKDTAAYSKAMVHRGGRMVRADYDNPSSRIRQHHKDVRLILEQGRLFNTPMFLTGVHDQILQAAELGGLEDADNAALIEVLRRLAGIPSF
jgi:3-hydroxyisobutyrate dehydrogenase-like beta-hydroxyacid dehydrogenase